MFLRTIAILIFAGLTTGRAVESASPPRRAAQEADRYSTSQRADPKQAERLQRVMAPLLRAMNDPRRLSEVRVSIVDDPDINAASGGNGEFYVTSGLLKKANDEHLRGVLAHEIAHDDLGHVASAQILGTGLNLGVILLEQFIPGSSAITPIAGTLIARGYSRTEESAADRHGVEILRRARFPKEVMINSLNWVMQTSKNGDSRGGFLSTHPATGERIAALRKLRQEIGIEGAADVAGNLGTTAKGAVQGAISGAKEIGTRCGGSNFRCETISATAGAVVKGTSEVAGDVGMAAKVLQRQRGPREILQYRGSFATMCPEAALMYAVLENAFLCFRKQFQTDGRCMQQAQQAQEWFFSNDSDGLFSFLSICQVLGLEPSYMRKRLKHWSETCLIHTMP